MLPPPDARARLEALVAGGQHRAADTLADEMEPTAGGQDWFVRLRMTVAQTSGEQDRLLALAARLRVLRADNPASYSMACAVLRQRGLLAEAEALASEGLLAASDVTQILIEAASIAASAGQNELAFARWSKVRARAPEAPIGFNGPIALATRLRETALAARLIGEGLAAFPHDRTLLVAAAQEAARNLQWGEAERHWASLFALHPTDANLVLDAVRSLQGRRGDRATRRPVMLRFLHEAQSRLPDRVALFARELDLWRDAGELARAAALGQETLARFPGSVDIGVLCADMLGEQRRPDDAVRLLEEMRPRCQPNAAFEAACVRLLCQAGRVGEAESVCEAALARFAGEAKLVEQHIAMAARRGDFEEAARRAAHWRAAFPHSADILAVARRMEMLGDGTTEAARAHAPDPGGMSRLFGRFESLGADAFGCEFGMVQRGFGAEPIGLLRWANIPMDGLAHAVETRFAGFGAPDHTLIETKMAEAGEREYFISDARTGYFAHTFIRASEAPQDRIALQSQRRLRFLAAKLAEDMSAGQKMFVYKSQQAVDPALLHRLFDACRLHGPATLLCAAFEIEGQTSGELRMLRPGLFLGCLSILSGQATAPVRAIDTPGWRRMCQEVARWQDATTPSSAYR